MGLPPPIFVAKKTNFYGATPYPQAQTISCFRISKHTLFGPSNSEPYGLNIKLSVHGGCRVAAKSFIFSAVRLANITLTKSQWWGGSVSYTEYI